MQLALFVHSMIMCMPLYAHFCRKTLCLAIIAVTSCIVCADKTSAPPWKITYDSALQDIYKGVPDRALNSITNTLEKTHAAALCDLYSRALYDSGRISEAKSNDTILINAVLNKTYTGVYAHIAAAYASLRMYKYENALQFLKNALKFPDADAEVYTAAGDLYSATHDPARAAKYYNKAVENSTSTVYIAFRYASMQKGDDAHAIITTLCTNVPWFFPAQCSRIRMLCNDKKYEEAESVIEDLLPDLKDNLTLQSLHILHAEMTGDTGKVARMSAHIRKTAPEWSMDITLRAQYWHSQRLFKRAAALAEKARAIRPDDDDAVFLLAQCHLERGENTYARTLLEDVLQRNPYHRTTFNFLQALDYIDATFVSVTSAHCIVRLHPRDARVIGTEVTNLVETYWHEYTSKYAIIPEVPLRIDMMNRHGDFAARTLGVPTLGALGVCFGSYVALTSPLAHNKDVNWEQVLKHEFIHVLTLQASGKGIHRWYTEGFSVYEEDAPQPYRTPHVLNIFAHTSFVSFCTFDRLFASQNVHGAYQLASDAVRFFIDTYGWDAVRDSVKAYTNAPYDPTLPARAFGVSTQALDTAFITYVTNSLLPKLQKETNSMYRAAALTNNLDALIAYADTHVDKLNVQLAAAKKCGTNQYETALRLYHRAFHIDPYDARIYPEWLALLRQTGNATKAVELSETYTYIAPHDPLSYAERARSLLAAGRYAEARRAYEDATYYALDEKRFNDIKTALNAAQSQTEKK